MIDRHPITGCKVSSLIGEWYIDAAHMAKLHAEVSKYTLHQLVELRDQMKDEEEEQPYQMDASFPGVAVVHMSGVTSKYPTSFRPVIGGGSTVEAAKALRQAVQDPNVKSIMMHFEDCPGGTAAGGTEMVKAIRKADAMKPVFTHADDLATSAGQMYLAQGRRSTANSGAWLGSIGSVSRLIDSSKAAEMEGYKVIPIASGTLKSGGMPGTPVSEAHIAHYQKLVDNCAKIFVNSISTSPRSIKPDVLQALAKTAEVVQAERAAEIGLIDNVCTFEEAMEYASKYQSGQGVSHVAPSSSTKDVGHAGSPARSSAMALTADQVEQAHRLPGGQNLNAESTVADVLSVAIAAFSSFDSTKKSADDLATANASLEKNIIELKSRIPEPVNPALAYGHANLAVRELELMVKTGNVLPAQINILKPYLIADESKKLAVDGAVRSDGSIMIPMSALSSILSMNKPNGLMEEKTGLQAQPRTEPGAAPEKKPTLEQINVTRKTYGLPLYDQAAYDKAVAQGNI